MLEKLENPTIKPPENVFQTNFNEFSKTRTEPTSDKDNKEKDQKGTPTDTIPDTSKGPRPGNIPSVKLSEGTDVYLPDVDLSKFDPNVLGKKKEATGELPKDKTLPTEPVVKPTDTTVKPTDPVVKTTDTTVKTIDPVVKPADTTVKPADVVLPKNVHVDATSKKIDKIDYGDKTREFKHDPARGLVGVRQTDSTGVKDYVKKEDGKWYLKSGTADVPLSGEFDLRANGDFCLRNAPTQPWNIQAPDGKVSVETPQVKPTTDTTGGGARRPEPVLTADKHGNVATVTLPDGSTRGYKFDESGKQLLQITDRVKTAGGERVEQWTRQASPTGGFGDKFVRTSPAGSTELRANVTPRSDGGYDYTDAKGEKKVSQVAMQGDAKPDTPWKANVERDEQGRYKSIENERFKRTYEYFEGSTTKIKSYHVVDKQSGQSATWTRSAPDSANWTAQTGDGRTATLQGEFAVTDDGVHVIQRVSCSWGEGKDNYAFLGNGQKVGIKATEDGKGLAGSEGNQSRYVKRGDGSSVAYTNGDNSQISVYDGPTKQRVTWNRGSDGLWKSDSPYEPDARKDLKFNESGELSYVDDKGSTRTRTLAGEEIVAKKDGSKLIYNNQGKLSKVQFGDVTRTFQKDAKGGITGILESNSKGESKTIFPPALAAGQKLEDAQLNENGDLNYTIKAADGKVVSKITERSNGLKLERDKDDSLVKSSKPNGITRRFEYTGDGDKKQLLSVSDTHATKDGDKTTVWARQANPQGGLSDDFHSKTESGKEKPARKIGKVLGDGEYEYTTAESKVGDKVRIQGLTGGDGSGFSGSVEEARMNLLESMEKNLDEPRLKRMEEMMKAFEERMTGRAQARKLAGVTGADQVDDEVSKSVAGTYDNLAQMVNSDETGTFYDKNQRAFLAENFMFHAQDPTTMDQGSAGGADWDGHGTCWIQSAHIWGLTQRTEHMADLLKQVSLTGSYTTKNSGTKGPEPKTVKFSKDYLKFPDGFQETGWSISKATDTWDQQPGMMRQCDGDRSPVGKIFDYTLPVLGGRSQSARAMDGGTHASFTTTGGRWYTGNAEIMQMVTGDKPCDVKWGDHGEGTLINGDMRKTLLEKGTVLNYSPGHAKSIHLKQVEGQWCVIQDNQHGENDDKIVARISNLEAWARGDKNAEKQVNEPVNQKKYKLASDSTIKGMIKPTEDSNKYNSSPSSGGGSSYNSYDPSNGGYNNPGNGNYYPNNRRGGRWR